MILLLMLLGISCIQNYTFASLASLEGGADVNNIVSTPQEIVHVIYGTILLILAVIVCKFVVTEFRNGPRLVPKHGNTTPQPQEENTVVERVEEGILKRFSGLFLLFCVNLAIAYDNFALAVGSQFGVGGARLMAISMPRFYLHAFLTPVLVLVGYDINLRAGDRLMTPFRYIWAILAYLILLAVGLYDLFDAQYNPACGFGLVRISTGEIKENDLCEGFNYPEMEKRNPPFGAIGTIIIVIFFSARVWYFFKHRLWGIGCILMLIAAMLPSSRIGTLASNGGEVCLMIGFTFAQRWLLNKIYNKKSHSEDGRLQYDQGKNELVPVAYP